MKLLLILATIAAPTTCAHFKEAPPLSREQQQQARDAQAEASRRCPLGEAIVRGNRSGTSPVDYECERPAGK